jgi:hypothetical protein
LITVDLIDTGEAPSPGITRANAALENGIRSLDKCVNTLVLPVWAISPDKSRAIEAKDQSIRNGRVLTYTGEGGRLDSHENHDHGARASPLLGNKGNDQDLRLELICGTEFPDKFRMTRDPIFQGRSVDDS